ncbi:MAG: hypothetical protein RL322_2130 [Pseudomonadota bacterium]
MGLSFERLMTPELAWRRERRDTDAFVIFPCEIDLMDHLGYRAKFGVLGPSTNTIVQPDFDDLRPVGVTNHYSRIVIPNDPVASSADFEKLVENINRATFDATDSVRTCEMDYLVMGMSAATFWNGRAGAMAYRDTLAERAGVPVSCGSFATEAALNTLKVKRIAFLSPYFEVANDQVRRFYQDCGFTVVRDLCLKRPSPVQIAHTTNEMCRKAILELDGDDVDAIVQVGTNLSMIRLAAAAELFLGKPVIAINTATYWHALRTCNIQDRKAGFGSLMEYN